MTATSPNQTRPWSAVSNGLRGRLVADRPSIPTTGQFRIALEFENTGPLPASVQVFNPFALTAVVRDASGAEVKPAFQRADVLSVPQWESVPSNTRRRFPISIRTEDGAAPAQLDLSTSVWRLSPGRYQLAGRYSSNAFFGSRPPGAWAGTLDLPPIPIEVK